MSTINIGGFNLDSNEIIDVTCKEVWYTALVNMIEGFILMICTLGTLGSILEGEFFWTGVLLLVFSLSLVLFLKFFVFGVFRETLQKFKITVKTMSSGEIKIHTKVFDEDDASDYYEELKTYV